MGNAKLNHNEITLHTNQNKLKPKTDNIKFWEGYGTIQIPIHCRQEWKLAQILQEIEHYVLTL